MEMVVMVVEVLKKKKIAQVTSIRTASLEAKSSDAVIQKAQLTITVARHPEWNPTPPEAPILAQPQPQPQPQPQQQQQQQRITQPK